MKYGLLVVGTQIVVNIGDYVQALAAKQFLHTVDKYVEREEVSRYNSDDIAMIMNGWYMHDTKSWPPSSLIHPLYVSVHINSKVRDKLVSENKLDTFKVNGPVGCRDMDTLDYLKSNGIDSYFSGCMTLTLGQTYKSKEKDDKIYFVDPAIPYTKKNILCLGKYCIKSLENLSPIYKIYKKKYSHIKLSKHTIISWVEATRFYIEYSKMFDKDVLLNAEYSSQQNEYLKNVLTSDDMRFEEAERLVKNYARAKYVVTSRIHCALPCLGLETPVVYVYDDSQDEGSYCRLRGLVELFNVMHLSKEGHLLPCFGYDSDHKITAESPVENKVTWKPLADKLIERCKEFCKKMNDLYN